MPLVPVPKPTFAQKLKRFFMVDLLKGLGLTLRFNLGALTDRDSVAGKGIYTEQYPKVRPDVAPRFHGAPRLNMDPETHDTLCIACNLCALACPEDCIDVIPIDVEVVVAGKPRRKKVLDEFIFDTSRCMFCALCQEACPTYCLELTQDFELATYSRAGLSGTAKCSNRDARQSNTNREGMRFPSGLRSRFLPPPGSGEASL